MKPTFLQHCLLLLYTLHRKKRFNLAVPGTYIFLTFSDLISSTKVSDDYNHTLNFLVQDEKGNPLGKESDIQTITDDEDISEEYRNNFHIMLTREFTLGLPLRFEKVKQHQIKITWKKPF
ncbi:MAG: hypothetical protein WC595_06375 [Candidatus Nanoarchaeia archaeon]